MIKNILSNNYSGKRIILVPVLLIVLSAFPACEQKDIWELPSDQVTEEEVEEEVIPGTVASTMTPGSNSWLSGTSALINSELTVVFDASMDTGTLAVSGTMASESQWVWSTTTLTNDTLTITPLANRTNGSGETITVECSSVDGDIASVSGTYNIAASVYYADVAATGTFIGTRAEPMNVIQDAVDAASGTGTPGVVLVAEGTFYCDNVLSTTSYLVDMADDVSLYGGYSSTDWEVRDPAVYVTSLQDVRTTSVGGMTVSTPYRVINFSAGIGLTTILDGFEIWAAPVTGGPSGPSACTIFIDNASPVVRNNVLRSFDLAAGSGTTIMGIRQLTGGSPEITNNTFNMGIVTGSNSGCSNRAIFATDSSPLISGNSIQSGQNYNTYAIYLENCTGSVSTNPLIDGGTALGAASAASNAIYLTGSTTSIQGNGLISAAASTLIARGILLENSSNAVIADNTIDSLSGTIVHGILVDTQSKPVISSNFINVGDNDAAYGIYIINEDTVTGSYMDIYNNVIDAGSGTTTGGIQIYSNNTIVRILNNTINGGGSGTFSSAIILRRTLAPSGSTEIMIANNNLFTDMTSTDSFGIYEYDANAYPNTVWNNNIFNCNYLYNDFSASPISAITALNGVAFDGTVPAQDNISENIYADLDSANWYRFTGDTSLVVFDTDGLDGDSNGWGFADDCEHTVRTGTGSIGWSTGAFEYD